MRALKLTRNLGQPCIILVPALAIRAPKKVIYTRKLEYVACWFYNHMGYFWTPETDSGGRIASRADHGPDADLCVEAGRLVEDGPIREHALVGPGAEGVSTRELKTGSQALITEDSRTCHTL